MNKIINIIIIISIISWIIFNKIFPVDEFTTVLMLLFLGLLFLISLLIKKQERFMSYRKYKHDVLSGKKWNGNL